MMKGVFYERGVSLLDSNILRISWATKSSRQPQQHLNHRPLCELRIKRSSTKENNAQKLNT